jgi:hypothetical protein
MLSLLFSTLSACKPGELPPEDGLQRDELGTLTTDADGGIDVNVSVPAGSVSTLVYCGPYGYDLTGTADSLTGPDGAVLYDRTAPAAPGMRVDDHADLLPLLLPVSPELDIEPGDYTWRISFDSPDPVSVTCNAVHRTDPVGATSTLDLRVVFIGVDTLIPGLNAATGADIFDGVLADVESIWSPAGLGLGAVSYADFEGDVETYTVVEGAEELGTLMRTANPDDARVLTVYVVQEILGEEGEDLRGVAGGPPGAAGVGGTSQSAIVLSAADVTAAPGDVARVLAHEIGNFLGLFDTSDEGGARHDPLSDTPQCTNDADGNGLVTPNECEGTGAENLMFWSISGDAISEDQAWVIARSPAVY